VALERIRRWTDAALAAQTVGLDCQRRALANPQPVLGGGFVDEGQIARSLICEIAMARQMSTNGAETLYGFAHGLARMPATARLLADGVVSQRVARAVVDEVRALTAAQTRRVDAQLAPELPQLTARRAAQAARRLVIGIDPHAADVRAKAARADRHVSAVAAPDAMGRVNLFTTADQAWACFGALDSHARGLKADGDERTIGQIMADTAVERISGQSLAADVGVEVNLLMRPETLFGAEDTPAVLAGYGPIPPETARQMAAGTRTWVRRLFTDEDGDTVTGRDPRRRRFDGPLGDLIRAADQHCQQPCCDCRIVDIDHRTPHHQGGQTVRANADGYCERSHTTRHLPGWSVTCTDQIGGIPRVIEWQTPTGHRYTSRRPKPLGHGPGITCPKVRPGTSPMERHLAKLVGTHGHRRQ